LVGILKKSHFYKCFTIHADSKVKYARLIVLGSSRALTGIDTKTLGDSLHLKAYNLAMDDTKLSLHKVLLEELLKEGSRPKILILAYDNMSDSSEMSSNDWRMLPLIHSSQFVSDYMKQYHGMIETNAYKYFPFLYFGKYNTELFFPAFTALIKPTYTYRANAIGDYQYPETIKIDSAAFNFLQKNTRTVQLSWNNPDLLAIEKLCVAYNIQLILYLAPVAGQEREISGKDLFVINASSILSAQPQCFADSIHVNTIGRAAATRFLIDQLRLGKQ